MLFKLLNAMAQKHWQAASPSVPVPHTTTPIAHLTQRSAVDFGGALVPMILAQGAGLLIRTVVDRNIIFAIGTLKYRGSTVYRAYLSQGEGAYLHIAVLDTKPTEVAEFRLYQPYAEFGSDERGGSYTCTMEEALEPQFANVPRNNVAPQGTDPALIFTTWLLENPNPQIGGMIGCPTIYGKPTDVDPAADPPAPYLYNRTWTPGPTRISPLNTIEQVLDGDGRTTQIEHDMMAYARQLKDATKFEHLMVSAAAGPDGASVVYWLGVDMDPTDVTIYPPAAPG